MLSQILPSQLKKKCVVRLWRMVNVLTPQRFTVIIFSVIVLTLSLSQMVLWLQDLIFKNPQLVLHIAKSFAICH